MQPVTALLVMSWVFAYALQRFGGESTAQWMMQHLALSGGEFAASFGWVQLEDTPVPDRWPQVLSAFTHAWLHAGPFHLVINILFARVFMARLEERLGSPRTMLLFLGSCAAAAAVQIGAGLPVAAEAIPSWLVQDPAKAIVGASSGLSGVLAAYGVYYWRTRILVLPLPIPVPVTLPLWVALVAWLALQAPPVLRFLSPKQAVTVAWLAHFGGFALCLMLAPLVRLGASASLRAGTQQT